MTPPPATYGDDRWENRRDLRAALWEIAGGRCEHPVDLGLLGNRPERCPAVAAEMAHIVPRGMGHTGYRDTLNNVMAACPLHARTTDDRSHPAWSAVPPPHDRLALAEWVKEQRLAQGWAL